MLLLTSSTCMTRCTERVTPVTSRVSNISAFVSCPSTVCSPQGRPSRYTATNLPPFDPLRQQRRAWSVSYPHAVAPIVSMVS